MKIWGTYSLQQKNYPTLKIDVLVITQLIHAPITTTFKISELRTKKRKLFNLCKAYKWDSQRGEIFQSLLNDNETKRQLEALCDQLKEKNRPVNIQDITKAFTKFLIYSMKF